MIASLVAAVLLAAPPAAAPGSAKQVEVGVSEQSVLEFPGATRVAVGDPNVADVHVDAKGEVLLTGKTAGRTTLIVWTGAGAMTKLEVAVTARTVEALQKLLDAFEGDAPLTVTELNGKRVVQGKLTSLEAMRRLQTLVEGDDSVVLLVELERSAKVDVVAQINAALQKAGLKGAQAELVGNKIFLEGQVEEEADARRAQLIADTIYGSSVEPLR